MHDGIGHMTHIPLANPLAGTPPGRYIPSAGTPPAVTTPPLADTPPAHIRSASGQYASYWNGFLLPPAMKLVQGYVFTGVCDSVHRGGAVPDQVPPQTRYSPLDQVHPPGTRYTPGPGTPPRTRYTPQPGTPPDQVHPTPPPRTRYTPLGPGTPPDQVHPPPGPGTPPPGPGRYGLRAGGTHPTGMHSC